ncbi:MAG: prepilin-type N-terminal cleavage/methylation domain-containing protein [Solirubrobacterales bacterium]
MISKIRNRMESEQGFTLIELLVVILIIGILAAIAIPSFLNQREKGQDACAKSMARTMQTAMETYYIDNNSYAASSVAQLGAIESQVTSSQCGAGTNIVVGQTAASGACTGTVAAGAYCVSATSAATSGGSNHSFAIARDTAGKITRTCGPVSNGGCVAAGTW